jgi:outer membrane immunogenic protein
VFSLFGASGPKLDLRGSVGYTQNDGDRFINVHGDQQKYAFSTWTGTGSLTLFSTSTLASGAVLRPYIQAYVRQEWDYKNEFSAVDSGGNSLGVSPHDQSHTYGGVDAGLTYTFQNMTFGAAVYYEASGDERTLGGRLGASVKLDDVRSSGIPARRSPDWEGFYVGANAGHGWGVADATASTSCALTVTPPPLPVPLPGYFCNRISQNKDLPQTDPADLARAAAVSQTGSGPIDPSGFTGGVQAGRNWQAGNVVVGVEFDANAFNLSGSRSASGLATAPVLAHTVGSSIDTDWLVTARGRIGWAASSMLFYATAGLALTDVKLAFSYRDAGGAALDASSSDIKAGLAVGGGLEWALSRNWSVKGEYLFVDFGRVTSFGSVENGAQRSPYSVSTDLSTHIARLGLNYKF